MSQWPALGFFDEGADLASPEFYASATGASRPATVLPPAAFRSLSFSMLEDEAIWSQDWICVGSLDDIPAEGDLLPFTIGNHGVHVQRMANGLEARFNKAQHGGCRAIPLQCQTGAKTKCSFTSCGYSRDRRAVPASELGDATPAMHQYLGLRPERLLRPAVQSHGPLIFVNLNPASPWPADSLVTLPGQGGLTRSDQPSARSQEVWLEFSANWKIMASTLVAGALLASGQQWIATRSAMAAGSANLTAAWLFPNLVLLCDGPHTATIVLQPTALGQTLCRVSANGQEPAAALERWLAVVRTRAAEAEATHAAVTSLSIPTRPLAADVTLPEQTSVSGQWMQKMLAGRVARIAAASSPHARVASF